jgi:hypothetical protein
MKLKFDAIASPGTKIQANHIGEISGGKLLNVLFLLLLKRFLVYWSFCSYYCCCCCCCCCRTISNSFHNLNQELLWKETKHFQDKGNILQFKFSKYFNLAKIKLLKHYRDEVDWSNNVLLKFIFFFWMPFFRNVLIFCSFKIFNFKRCSKNDLLSSNIPNLTLPNLT